MATVQLIPGGWGSFTFLVDGDHILRFARNADVAAAHHREAALLPKLADAVSFRVPEPDFFGSWGEGGTCLGYPLIEGRGLTAADGWRAMAGVLRELHGFPVDVARSTLGVAGTVDEWRSGYRTLWADVEARVLPALEDDLAGAIAAEFAALLAGDWDFQPVLVHGDMATEHVLVDDAGRVVGLIDFEDATVGDPAIDFAGLLPLLDEQRIDQLIADYGRAVDRERLRHYWRLVPVHDLRYGLTNGHHAITDAATAEARRRFTLADPARPAVAATDADR
ncbi:MAG TPA: phosphotransferase [Pseudonocardiaceae bacterium]|jgi:aminoglycoside 2''-phosphotransferase|nr:phosphotransferase [Pseudonocardiaceae bacterium]